MQGRPRGMTGECGAPMVKERRGGVPHMRRRALCPLPSRGALAGACTRARAGSGGGGSRSGNGAAGPRVRAASGSGCESGSGRLEPGAGRGPGSSVRRRRRRLGRRVEASGGQVGRVVAASSRAARVPGQRARAPLPAPLPVPFSPSPTAPSLPRQGQRGRSLSVLPSLAHPHRPCFSFPCPGQPPP